MENSLFDPAAIRMLAVLFLFAMVLGRRGGNRKRGFAAAALLAVAVAAATMRDGTAGLVHSLSGVITALALGLPLFLYRRLSRTDMMTSCAIGGILGPQGYTLAFSIVVTLVAVQLLLKSALSRMPADLPASRRPIDPELLEACEKSSLAEIEERRFDETFGGDRTCRGRFAHSGPYAAGSENAPWNSEMLPWHVNLALATLAVLMAGMP